MTPEEQKKRALEFMRALDRADGAALDKMIAPNFIFRLMSSTPGCPRMVERSEFVNVLPNLMRQMMPNGFNFVYGTTIAEGPHVSVQGTGDALTATGKRYANTYHWYVHFDGDKIDECREYLDGYVVMKGLETSEFEQLGP